MKRILNILQRISLWQKLLAFHLLAIGSLHAQSTILFEHEPLSGARPLYNNPVASLKSIGSDSLICFWFGGVSEGTTDNRILYRLSDDKGMTWGPATVLLDAPNSDTLYRDPSLWQSNGKMYLIFILQVGQGGANSASAFNLAYISSDDKGASWSNLKYIIPTGYNDSIRMVTPFNEPITIDGLPAFAVHWRITGSSQPHAGILLCDFGQDTFQLRGDIVEPYLYVEPAVLDNNDSLIMYFRASRGAIEYAVSKDDGFTWTAPKRTQVPNPYALVSLQRYNADTLLVAWNNASVGRNYLSIGLFKGYHFEELIWKKLIDTKPSKWGQVCYPSVVRDSDDLFISYSYRKEVGLDSTGKLIAFGDIMLHKAKLYEPRVNHNSQLLKDHQLATLVNKYLFVDSTYFMAGDDAFGAIYNRIANTLTQVPLPNSQWPYRMNTALYDSASASVTFAGDGGWLIQYDLSSQQTINEKRFINWGLSRINDIMRVDSNFYIIGHRGEFSSFTDVGQQAMVLIQDLSLDLRSFTHARDSIFIAADSQAVFAYSLSNGTMSTLKSGTGKFPWRRISSWGDSLILLGDRGAAGILYHGQYSDLTIDSLWRNYDYHGFQYLNDSLVMFISDQELALLYNTNTGEQLAYRLPQNALLTAVRVLDSTKVYFYTRQGQEYRINFNQLFLGFDQDRGLETWASEPLVKINPNPALYKTNIHSEIPIQEIQLTSLKGELLASFEIEPSTNFELDLSRLPKGLILVQINLIDGQLISTKLLNSSY